MLNFSGHLESLFSVLWSSAFGGGGKKVEQGKMLRLCSSGNAGKSCTGGTLGSKNPGGSSPERHG